MIAIFLTLILCFSPMPISQAADKSPDEPKNVLVIYDQLAIGTQSSNNLNAVEALLSSLSQTIEVVPMTAYQQGGMQRYAKVIILKNTENAITNEALKADVLNYTGEILYLGYLTPGLLPLLEGLDITPKMGQGITLNLDQMKINSVWVDECRVINQQPQANQATIEVGGTGYPFSLTIGNIIFVPTFTGTDSFQICLGGLLKNWLTPMASPQMLLLIPDIYPFSDLNRVIAMSDAFYAQGIPFTLGVVPFDDNLDYPAMARFYQVLRYVQSRNGSILIHRPSPDTVSDSNTALAEKIDILTNTMIKNGIYPLGLVTTEDLFFEDISTVNPLSLFSSGIISKSPVRTETGVKKSWTLNQGSLVIDFETVKNTTSQTRNFGNYPISTTIVLPLPTDDAALGSAVEMISNKWLSLTDYKDLNNQWVIGQNSMSSGAGRIIVNGSAVSLVFNEAPIDTNYAYQKPPDYSLEKTFNVGNRFLLLVVGIIIILFGGIVLFSRRVYLNKFRRIVKTDEKKDGDHNLKDKENKTP